MLKSPLALLLLTSSALAIEFAQPVPQLLYGRALVSSGGWALAATTCPADVQRCSSVFCCSAGSDCKFVGSEYHCCPKGTDCATVLEASPQCADDSWSLWSKTTKPKGTGYFCCLPGQIGTNTGTCVAGSSNVVATLAASLVSSATGVAGSSSASASTKASSTPSAASTTAASSTGTTTGTTTGTSTSLTTPATPAQTSKSSGGKLALGQVGYIGSLALVMKLVL
ncbi:hypothetical protein B0J14DRAFT_584931 [Halenospora varia]|nr:hypothetical protein B0J14DRAFT_584931 [Halenospora varia]